MRRTLRLTLSCAPHGQSLTSLTAKSEPLPRHLQRQRLSPHRPYARVPLQVTTPRRPRPQRPQRPSCHHIDLRIPTRIRNIPRRSTRTIRTVHIRRLPHPTAPQHQPPLPRRILLQPVPLLRPQQLRHLLLPHKYNRHKLRLHLRSVIRRFPFSSL